MSMTPNIAGALERARLLGDLHYETVGDLIEAIGPERELVLALTAIEVAREHLDAAFRPRPVEVAR